MNRDEEEKLFKEEIAPLVHLQRIYLREHGRIPPLNARYDKWKQKEKKELEDLMDTVVERTREKVEDKGKGF